MNEPIDGTLTGTNTLGLSGPGSNWNEEVLHIPQSFMTGASPSDAVSVIPRTHVAEVLSVLSPTSVDKAVEKLRNEL